MAKVTKLEKEKRVFIIQGWIVDGVPEYLILKQIKTQWNIGLRQARTYLKLAFDNWKQDEDVDIETRRQTKIAELQQLKRSLKQQHKGTPAGIKAILAIEKEIIRLEPYSVKRVDVTSKGEQIQQPMSKVKLTIKEHKPEE